MEGIAPLSLILQERTDSVLTVELESAESFQTLESALEDDPRLKVDVQRESDYYQGQSENISQLLYLVAYVVSSIMALGALFGALNTMYSAVSVRAVEIATLRAIGFGAMPVVVSVLIEALALALIGALAGVAIAWVLFNGDTFATGGGLEPEALSRAPIRYILGLAKASVNNSLVTFYSLTGCSGGIRHTPRPLTREGRRAASGCSFICFSGEPPVYNSMR